jgi:hypothetical protein
MDDSTGSPRLAWLAAGLLACSCAPVRTTAETTTSAGTLPPSFCSGYPQAVGNGQWQSKFVFFKDGKLTYATDRDQNRIPDYSYAGYRHGQAPLPSAPEMARVAPGGGDDTARIQEALDRVGARAADRNGIRGAVVLAPGRYEIGGTLHVNQSGVVLRGSGDGDDPARDSILLGVGNTPEDRSVLELGSGHSSWKESASTEITTPFVQVGARSFEVASPSGFSVGDEIVVRHPSTPEWIAAVDNGGVGADGTPWSPTHMDIVYYRRIAGLSGNRVTLDAPVLNHLDRRLAHSFIARVDGAAIREAGVENLRIDIVTAGGEDEEHARDALSVLGAHDSWVRAVTALHFRYAGIRLENAVRVTVERCRALDPVGVRTGGAFYNFASDRRAQLVLVALSEATGGRHSFVGNGLTWTSGNVYHRNRQRNSGSEGGHRGWTTGILYDNHDETGDTGQVLLINRGDAANPGQGWSAAHSTIWKYDGELVVQKPPTAQNYGITNAGHFRGKFFAEGPPGVQELTSGELIPTSLYEAQLCERLRSAAPPPDPVTRPPDPVTPDPPPPPPSEAIALEAEGLEVTNSGTGTSVETDARSSGGLWVALNATNAGSWMKLTTPVIPAGTYQVKLMWKGNSTRGIARFRVDDTALDEPLDQYSPSQTYPSATIGTVTFTTSEAHIIHMEVAGKNAASSRFGLSADRFTFVAD